MENIIFSANIVLPLLVLMVAGYLSKSHGWLDTHSVAQCNALVFNLFLPILLFCNVRASSLSSITSPWIFIYAAISATLGFVLATAIVCKMEPVNARRGAMIQGMARSNYSLFGIPLFIALFPNEDIVIPSILIAIVIPTFNVCSVIVLTYFSSAKTNAKAIFLAVLKNPLIIGTFFGMVCLLNNITFPYFIEKSLTNLSVIATPFSLFLLGASFKYGKMNEIIKQIIFSVSFKLILLPVIAISIGIALGFRGVELGCIMVIFASPTAVSSYTMAEIMGADVDLASSIVVFTSIFCIFTVFLAILILKSFALI